MQANKVPGEICGASEGSLLATQNFPHRCRKQPLLLYEQPDADDTATKNAAFAWTLSQHSNDCGSMAYSALGSHPEHDTDKGAGAIGKDAMLEKGRLNPATNLQYGVTVATEDDVFLAATDGIWDTLDPVQVRESCHELQGLVCVV